MMANPGKLLAAASLVVLLLVISCSRKKEIKTIDQPYYELQYHADWNLDTLDQSFDLDHYFLMTPHDEDAMVSFFFYDTTIDMAAHLEAQIQQRKEQTMPRASITYFETWAGRKGKGAILKGKLMGLMEGEQKIFIYSDTARSFMMVSQLFDNDRNKYLPNLQLIESSFKVK